MSKEKRRGSELPATAADEAAAFATRRKVIKGLASTVPVALTLSNGAAMADASSHQCLTNQLQGSDPNCTRKSSNKDPAWVYGPNKVGPPDPRPPDASNNSANNAKYCVQYASEDGNTTPSIPALEGYNYSYKDTNGEFKRIFINQDGSWANGGTALGNPLTTSCGNSFT